jgi:hypothetical protein
MNTRTVSKFFFGAMVIFFIFGCTGLGPRTIPRDRFDYARAISDSWKGQMLLNMVKLRYADVPVFVDVASVISQYTLEGQIELSAGWSNSDLVGDNQMIGGSGKYSDRPTITYSPLVGEKFSRSMTKPIPPPAIFFLIQAGYPADVIFRTCVQAVNGIHNRSGSHSNMREADPEFYRLLLLMRDIQKSGATGMRIEEKKEKQDATIFTLRQKRITAETEAKISTTRRLLGLDPQQNEFNVTYGSTPKDANEIAVLSRSMYEIIVEMASYIDVPESHLADGRVNESLVDQMDVSKEFGPLLEIQSGDDKPKNAFVKARYDGYWFWIDKRDLRSKRMFTFLMLLFAFTEKEGPVAPLVTVPAG